MTDDFDLRPVPVEPLHESVGWTARPLREHPDTEEGAVPGFNSGGTFIVYGGGTIASVVGGTAILGADRDMASAYTVAEDHMHEQQRWPPLEAIECISIVPIALDVCYEGGRRVFSRRKPDR